MKLGELRWPQIKALDIANTMVLIPTGSMEQHGPHLPLEVDAFIAGRLAEDLERRMPAIVIAPPVWAGVSAHHMDFPGSITLRPRVFVDLLRDICASLHQHGFRRFVFLNGHGGNRASLEVLATELYEELKVSANVIVYWDLASEEAARPLRSSTKGFGHASAMETSVMLYLAPELVSQADIPRGALEPSDEQNRKILGGRKVKRYVNITEYSAVGVDGRPEAASREAGERFYQAVLSGLVDTLKVLQKLPS